MHSIYVTLTLKETAFPDENAQRAHLDRVVADVSAKAGFRHGYWLAPTEGVAHAMVLFDTEANAIAGAPEVGSEHSGVARITGVELAPVLASV